MGSLMSPRPGCSHAPAIRRIPQNGLASTTGMTPEPAREALLLVGTLTACVGLNGMRSSIAARAGRLRTQHRAARLSA